MGSCRGEGWVVRRTGRGIVDEIREKKKERVEASMLD